MPENHHGTRPSVMDVYARVSRVGDRQDTLISDKVQVENGTAWAKLKGVEVGRVHVDLDQSGGKLKRPGLDALMERIRSGETQGVIVARLDRLSRAGVSDALRLVEEIHDAGATLAALDYGLDPTTPFGEFGLTLLLGLARMEHRRLSESFADSKVRAMKRGAKISPTPFGYRRLPGGVLGSHPTEAAKAQEAFTRAARGGLQSALAYLVAESPERVWTTSTVRRFLAKRTYLGESRYGDMVKVDAHPALVDRATWEAAQAPEPERRRPPADFPLSGLASCGTCGAHLVGSRAGQGGGKSIRMYRCAASLKTWKGEPCPNVVSIVAERLEDYVVSQVRDALALTVQTVDRGADDLAALERAVLDAERELDDFLADTQGAAALRRVGRYQRALDERVEAVEAAQVTYREAATRAAAEAWSIPAAEAWADMTPEEVAETLRRALADVVVRKATRRGRYAEPIAERVVLVQHDADVDPGAFAADGSGDDGPGV